MTARSLLTGKYKLLIYVSFRCDVYKQKFYQMHKTLMLNQAKET